MKTSKIKKIMVWVLAVLLMISAFGGTALAEEGGDDGTAPQVKAYAPMDTYVLTYDGESAKPYMYGSSFAFEHSYNDPSMETNPAWSAAVCSEVFHLVNSLTNESIAAYRTDANTEMNSNASYQCVALEDTSYQENGAAGRLRAVILNTFPQKSVADVEAAANAAGFAVIELKQGELIAATQQAIWKITYGDMYTVNSRFSHIVERTDAEHFVYPELLNETDTEYTVSNVENLYQYFMAMAPVESSQPVLTSATFTDKSMYVMNNDDGTQQSVLNAVVNVEMAEGTDSLVLSVVADDQVVASQTLEHGENTFTLTLPGCVKNVTLAIDGMQTVSGVYLFKASGENAASPSMVGYDSNSLPIHVETMVELDNAISITKITTTTEQDAEGEAVTVEHPLYGIEFDVYYVCDMETYNANLVEGILNADILAAKQWVASMATDGDGKAFCDVSLACKNKGIADTNGVYQVVEKAHPAIEEPAEPVLVFLPYTTETEDDQTTVYTAELKLNNTVKPAPEVNVDVAWIDNNRLSVSTDAAHTWIIRGEVPADMANAEKYEITDLLDYRLSYIPDSLVVKAGVAGSAAGTESLTLTEGTHYTMNTEVLTNEQGHGIDCLKVSLTEAGMQAVGTLLSDGQTYEVRVYFAAKIDANGTINTEIPNQAELTYANSVGFAHDKKDSDVAVVYTHGLRIYKYDAANTELGLQGAVLKVARLATQSEIDAGISHPLVMRDDQTAQVVYESFYTVPDWTAETAVKVDHVVTGEDGLVMVYGLAEGTYYLVEVKAPGGYNLMSHPKEAPVHATSDLANGGTGVPGSSQFVLPDTGGIGTLIFTVGGGLLIAAAVLVLVKNKKAETEDEDEE